MIERTYMGIDARRDHGFRVPRPDLAATGAPNACTDCHADRPAAWAAEEIARRFPDSDRRGPHFATAFAAARWVPEEQAPALLAIAEGDGAGIVRATALELMPPVAGGEIERVTALLADPDPLVRAAAAGALRSLPGPERLARLAPALADPRRVVRVAAARALLDIQPPAGSAEAVPLAAAMEEWRAALASRADFPETHMQIGGTGLTTRDWRLAERAFAEAASLDPQLVDAWAMVVRIRAGTGDMAGARAALAEAMAKNPGNPALAGAGGRRSAPPDRDRPTVLRQARRASRVIGALRTLETGQVPRTFSAALWKAAGSAPGIFARTVRCTEVISKPPSTRSTVTAAEVSIASAVIPAASSAPESAME